MAHTMRLDTLSPKPNRYGIRIRGKEEVSQWSREHYESGNDRIGMVVARPESYLRSEVSSSCDVWQSGKLGWCWNWKS